MKEQVMLETAVCSYCGERNARPTPRGWVCINCKKPWKTEMVKRPAADPIAVLTAWREELVQLTDAFISKIESKDLPAWLKDSMVQDLKKLCIENVVAINDRYGIYS